ncbi:proline-rich protein 2-like [Phocoena sinus]|uniref:proline-rich protein 2-like n=1 Tax=Phocoena sinus TaxID=42100 RepID=UPI0013C534CA|nr:proline-rich protein 2-like [Phocoena sinus]
MVPEARAGPAEGRQGGRRLLGREAWLCCLGRSSAGAGLPDGRGGRARLCLERAGSERVAGCGPGGAVRPGRLMQPLKFCASSVNGERVTRNPLSISQKAREKAAVFVESDRSEKVEKVYCWAALSLVRGSRKRSPLRALGSSSGKGRPRTLVGNLSGLAGPHPPGHSPSLSAGQKRSSSFSGPLGAPRCPPARLRCGPGLGRGSCSGSSRRRRVAGRREQHEAPQPAQHGPAGAGPRRRGSQAASLSGPSESVPPAAAPPAAFSTPRSRRAAGPRSQRECGGGWTRVAAVPRSLRRGAPRLWLSGGARGASEGPPRGRPWPRRYAGVGPPGSWKLRLQTRRPRPFQRTVDSGAEGSLGRGAPTTASRERSGVEDLTGQTQRAFGSS